MSRGLIELLSHYTPSGHGQAEQSLLAKISRLREELNIHYARSQPELRPIPSLNNFETIAFKEQELARTLREVSGTDPEYVSLQQVSIATIESVQARTGITVATLRKELRDLPRLASLGDGRWIHRDVLTDFRRRAIEFLDAYFKMNKMAMNVPKGEFVQKLLPHSADAVSSLRASLVRRRVTLLATF